MLFRWLLGEKTEQTAKASDELRALVAHSVPDATPELCAIVGALAGLFAVVAYADRKYESSEREAIREAVARVHGLPQNAVGAVCELLDTRIVELAHEPIQTYTRVLYEGTERSARLEVLDVLVDLAATDDSVDMDETNLLRRVAKALGLSDDEYITSQSRHRARLTVLRNTPTKPA